MRKILLILLFLPGLGLLCAQVSPVDELFNKYSEQEGFTVVTISGKMFNLFAEKDQADNPAGQVVNSLKSIMILSVEDSTLNRKINFYNELSRSIDFSGYEEMMVVKEGQDITKFLVRQKGDRISEMLVITGGPGGNSLISIRGDLDLKAISEMSESMGLEDMEGLEDIEK